LSGDLPNLAEEAPGLTGLRALGADAARPRPKAVVVIAHGRRSARSCRSWAGVPRQRLKMLAFAELTAPCRLGDGAAPTSVQTTASPPDRSHRMPSALSFPSRLPACFAPSAGG